MDIKSFFASIGRGIAKAFKKVRRFFKKYIRLLVRHTKAKDYSVLMYTIFALIAFVLIITLFVNILKPDKKEKTKEKKPTPTDASSEVPNPDQLLANEARAIYDKDKDILLLVNNNNALPENYEFEQHVLNSGFVIDERAYIDLYRFTKACNDADLHYSIISAYRDKETQQGIIDRSIQDYMDMGLSEEEAKAKTNDTVQQAGYSEHETGLALDLSDEEHFTLTDDLEKSPTIVWFTEHCYEYGFILRYPKDKADITGIAYEPWHFRYVGVDAAQFMHENNLTLEEFHQLLAY